MSIFVNPTQFNDPADLAAYPRDEAGRRRTGRERRGRRAVRARRRRGLPARVQRHRRTARARSSRALEGARRGAGHFRGVTTVVSKLLGMAQPDRAYFGQKDAQQARVVRAMVADLNIDTEIVTVPTVREPDGLAMSSRNRRLSPADRAQAVGVSQALLAARRWPPPASGTRRGPAGCRERCWPATASSPEYLALVDADTFLPVDALGAGPAVLAVAADLGGTRLIDNVLVEP